MSFTARQIARLLAEHLAQRDVAVLHPDDFNGWTRMERASESEQQLIKLFEEHHRACLKGFEELGYKVSTDVQNQEK